MASDTRLNYHSEKIMNGEKYQEIKCVADCCRKTFLLQRARMGIQFIGQGYLSESNQKYHLSYFLPKIESGASYRQGIQFRMKTIFANLKKITTPGDTGNYANGIMAGFHKEKPYIGTFNTFNYEQRLEIKKVKNGDFVDSEKILQNLKSSIEEVKSQIENAIKTSSRNKPHLIGDEIEILLLHSNWNDVRYLHSGKKLFYGTKEELLEKFKNDIYAINGKILDNPVLEKFNLSI